MKQPRFDLDLDKHCNATVVIACGSCGSETRQHLRSLQPDHTLRCRCGADISLGAGALHRAQQQVAHLRVAYRQ
ncbi:hypothetical protein [Gulbenkiania mobilis]|uniref:hypothetical protein n=1 Tax=Gulbenkiania mobilis TaxID=397457 RepID=UPI0006BBFBC0|nr:hypothetical protein [Gulbenkiania mobilis]